MMSLKKKKMTVPVICFLIGMFFLSNPIWAATDVLPDLFGWAMVWISLQQLAAVNDNMEAARKQTLYLIAVCILKTAAFFALQDSLYASDLLLAAVVASGLDVFLMTGFFHLFLHGMEELSRNADSKTGYEKNDNVRFMCSLFTWARAICTVIPELTAIPALYVSLNASSGIADDSENFYLFLEQLGASRSLFLVIFSVIEAVIAIAWLASVIPYVRLLTCDEALSGYLESNLQKESSVVSLEKRKRYLQAAKILMAVSMVFLLDFQISGIRFLPLCGMPLLMALVCLCLNRYGETADFRTSGILFLSSSMLLAFAEFYRENYTVWDQRAFAEVTVQEELLSGAIMIVCMSFLLFTWILFSQQLDRLCEPVKCHPLAFYGIPFFAFTIFSCLQTAMVTLPITANILTFPRICFAVLTGVVCVKRFSAFAEQAGHYHDLYQ